MRGVWTAWVLCVALLIAPSATADPVSAVDPSSMEGRAMLAPAFADLQARLGKPATLKVNDLNMALGWAFVNAAIEEPDGQPIDYSGTPFAEAAANGGMSKRYVALVRNSTKGWHLVTSRVGPTDVAWGRWSQEYGAPAAIFPAG